MKIDPRSFQLVVQNEAHQLIAPRAADGSGIAGTTWFLLKSRFFTSKFHLRIKACKFQILFQWLRLNLIDSAINRFANRITFVWHIRSFLVPTCVGGELCPLFAQCCVGGMGGNLLRFALSALCCCPCPPTFALPFPLPLDPLRSLRLSVSLVVLPFPPFFTIGVLSSSSVSATSSSSVPALEGVEAGGWLFGRGGGDGEAPEDRENWNKN